MQKNKEENGLSSKVIELILFIENNDNNYYN